LSRTLQLPEGVQVCISFPNILNEYWLTYVWLAQEEQIKATLKNGVLTVTFPKTSHELAPKKIVIQSSDSDKEEYHTDFNVWPLLFQFPLQLVQTHVRLLSM
jgi:hypothetical protein